MQLQFLALFLVVATLLIVRAANRDKRDYSRFKSLTDTKDRQKVFRSWLRDAFLINGGLAAAILLAVWALLPDVVADSRAHQPLIWLAHNLTSDFGNGLAIGAGVAFVVLLVVPVFAFRKQLNDLPTVGDISALLPQTRGELPYGILLSINAGVIEELLFRLAMPALLFGITGSGAVSFAVASVLFGMLHIYQRLPGVIGATLLGVAFSLLYLLTQSIWITMAAHALIDLRSLVLIPLIRGVLKHSEMPKPEPAVVAQDDTSD